MPEEKRPLRVFLCHSSSDKPAVRELYQKLAAEGWIEPWLDEEKLYPGQDWNLEIEKAVEAADAIIVCLSKSSITKEGYVQRELRFALDIALTKPEETIFVIPLRFEGCEPPRRLRAYQYADYFPKDQREHAYQRLLTSLQMRAETLGLRSYLLAPLSSLTKQQEKPASEYNKPVIPHPTQEWMEKTVKPAPSLEKQQTWMNKAISASTVLEDRMTISDIEFVRIPAGLFLVGSKKDNKQAFDNEQPKHTVDLPNDYWMARFPVTNEQYAAYVGKGKHPVSDWQNKKDHPVVNVSWKDAMAYCRWLDTLLKGKLSEGYLLRLPTEAEWEKAARGTDGREWPWGNEFDKNKCNSSEGGKGGTTPVGLYSPAGDSPYGCSDMSGNVWEWCHSLYKPYPYNAKDGREDETASGGRVLRGGSFSSNDRSVRTASLYDDLRGGILRGFRVAVAPPIPKIIKS